MSKIRVLLVDDHHLFREGLLNILDAQVDFDVVGEAEDGLEALVKARQLRPDLILMDVAMPGCDGLEATLNIKREMPETTIVMLTVCDEDDLLFQAVKNGAQGYLLKSIRSQEMLALLRGAVEGNAAITPYLGGRMLEEFRRLSKESPGSREAPPTLTGREKEVLALAAQGASNTDIATELNISIHTVKSHMRNILAKLQTDQRHEAAFYARQQGLIPPNPDATQ